MIGIPWAQIEWNVLPIYAKALNSLNNYFKKRSTTLKDLHRDIKNLKDMLLWM
jgi:hypothetical protein